MASFFGIYGLSFWVLLTNALVAHVYFNPSLARIGIACSAVALPFIVGGMTLDYREKQQAAYDQIESSFQALLIHQKILPEEMEASAAPMDPIQGAYQTWKRL